MTGINRVELTADQDRKWGETKAALLFNNPAFSHILYTMLDNVDSKHVAIFTADDSFVPIAGTDGTSLILNVNRFFNYNLYERIFIVAHEIMHCILNHLIMMHQFRMRGKVSYADGTTLPYSHKLMNVAQDLVINDLLIDSKTGHFNKDWLHDKSIATAADSALDAYKKLAKKFPPQKGGCVMEGFDTHLDPGTSQGKDPTQASQERNETEWQTQIAAAANAARVQGKLPAALDRMFKEVLDPKVDWREHIQGLFARKVGSGGYNWRKPDRRLITRDIYAPSRSGFGAGDVVVGADTSGSIGDKEIDMFFGELAGILEDVRPTRLFIVWCDAMVHRVDECDDPSDLNVLRCKGAPGGGGTSFVPVFNWIAENQIKPDALVYLTDGEGSFPRNKPDFVTIWGNISGPDQKYPFGDVVNIPRQV